MKSDEMLRMVRDLCQQMNAAANYDQTLLRDTSEAERQSFKLAHPGAHMVVGDFEIKCLHPEKYGIEEE